MCHYVLYRKQFFFVVVALGRPRIAKKILGVEHLCRVLRDTSRFHGALGVIFQLFSNRTRRVEEPGGIGPVIVKKEGARRCCDSSLSL